MMREIVLGDTALGPSQPPFVIAEMSGNHNGSLEVALEIVDAAAAAGARAMKLQTYTADTLTLDVEVDEFVIRDPSNLWTGRSLHSLYSEACTPWEWHERLFARCREHGMLAFSTPFDEAAVDFLESLGAPCYKIASFENVHIPLIRKVATTGKPVFLSTGMATLAELDEAVTAAREAGCEDLVLLKCTSTYPANPDDSNVLTIPHMRELFDCLVGLSDHTVGVGASVAAVALGAVAIEKHLTLSRAAGGVDSAFSMEPDEFAALVEETCSAWRAIGSVVYGPTEAEIGSRRFRRSLYVASDMKAGDAFDEHNLRVVRPGLGLPPKYFDVFLGRRAARDARKGTPVTWDLLG